MSHNPSFVRKPSYTLSFWVVLIVLGTFAASHVGMFGLYWFERQAALEKIGGRQAADKIVQFFMQLDEASPRKRAQLKERFQRRPWRLSFSSSKPVLEGQKNTYTDALESLLKDEIKRPLFVRTRLVKGRHRPMEERAGHSRRKRQVAEVAINLTDQSWITLSFPVPKTRSQVSNRFLVLTGGAFCLLLLALVLMLRRAVRPFDSFADAAERVGRGEKAYLPEKGSEKVRQAAKAFNAMQGKITQLLEDRTRMLAAMSHDLRTPLTRMRLRAEFMTDDAMRAKTLADLEEMERMIAETLAFAKGEMLADSFTKIDLGVLLSGVAAAFDRDAAFHGEEGKIFISGHDLSLKRLFGNLVSNAVKYGTRADIYLEESDGRIFAIVADRGAGIPEAEKGRVFEAFNRLETSRSRETGGAGLGLSIAKSIVLQHQGSIHLENKITDAGDIIGLSVIVSLPAFKE